MTQINFKSAKYLISAPSLNLCPPDKGAEVAFAGRSNAGKSSVINTLARNNKLVRTSKTPGCTQQINFFQLLSPADLRLVDLPGYGYAKVPKAVQQQWEQHLSQYLNERQSLRGIILVTDIRHPMQESDDMIINWAVQSEMPLHVLLNKSDKLSRGAAQEALLKYRRDLTNSGLESLVSVHNFSSVSGEGVDQLAQQLQIWLQSDQ
ncbi:MAG: ribosome biogenesis GTP-binding protein YihA/YsxC [Candidatus Obscuribacterales bacterium]|nr:ribosome biogenesis GTP-binding protein YihA/YsxC [Candidatus Obscuribacterales bacterium]